MLKFHFIASIIFVLSTGATINQNNLYSEEDSPLISYEINELETHHNSCPIHPKPVDSAEIFENGFRNSGVYKVYPKHKIIPCGEIKVYCDMKTNGGGWTVIQRRGDYNRASDFFYKTWNEYKAGFGNLQRDFWLGNDNIHVLTNQKRYSVRFDLGTKNETARAVYDNFWIENEELKYRMFITDYSGTAGDSMKLEHKEPFSTKDRKNNNSKTDCAQDRKGGWWYSNCTNANLNGLYLKTIPKGAHRNATTWWTWKGWETPLSTVEIKIRPYGFVV